MMVCGNCGKESPEGSSVCVHCGAPPRVEGVVPPPPAAPPFYTQPPAKKGTPPWVWVIVAFAVVLCTCPVGAAILFPVFAQARMAAKRTVALSQEKQVALAALLYSTDSDDKFPPFSTPEDVTSKISAYFRTPELNTASANYDWNEELSGVVVSNVDKQESTWLFHSGELDSSQKSGVAFVDAHCKVVSPAELEGILSQPVVILKDDQDSDGGKKDKPK